MRLGIQTAAVGLVTFQVLAIIFVSAGLFTDASRASIAYNVGAETFLVACYTVFNLTLARGAANLGKYAAAWHIFALITAALVLSPVVLASAMLGILSTSAWGAATQALGLVAGVGLLLYLYNIWRSRISGVSETAVFATFFLISLAAVLQSLLELGAPAIASQVLATGLVAAEAARFWLQPAISVLFALVAIRLHRACEAAGHAV